MRTFLPRSSTPPPLHGRNGEEGRIMEEEEEEEINIPVYQVRAFHVPGIEEERIRPRRIGEYDTIFPFRGDCEQCGETVVYYLPRPIFVTETHPKVPACGKYGFVCDACVAEYNTVHRFAAHDALRKMYTDLPHDDTSCRLACLSFEMICHISNYLVKPKWVDLNSAEMQLQRCIIWDQRGHVVSVNNGIPNPTDHTIVH